MITGWNYEHSLKERGDEKAVKIVWVDPLNSKNNVELQHSSGGAMSSWQLSVALAAWWGRGKLLSDPQFRANTRDSLASGTMIV